MDQFQVTREESKKGNYVMMRVMFLKVSESLVVRLKKGESQAVKEWYEEYSPRVLSFVVAKVSDSQDAEEIMQEVFVNCLNQLGFFRGKSSLFTWMCSVARHEVADFYRKKYAKKALKYVPLGEKILAAGVEDAHESAAKVKTVLKQMGAESRELLMKKYIDCKRVKEISCELDKSVKAVESDLFRARREFKRLYALT